MSKTRTAIDAIERVLSKNPSLKIVIVVPTKVLQDQWKEKLDERDILAKVLVMNTAARKPFECDFLIIDEAHRINAFTLRQIFPNAGAKLIMGLTATYERLDGLEKEVLDRWAPVCDTVTLKESRENGWIAPYTEYKVLLDVDLTEYKKANAQFLANFAVFDYSWNDAMSAVTNPIAQQVIAKRMGMTVKEIRACAYAWNKALQFRKSFIANHPYKIEIAKKILQARPDSKAITFNSSIKQCEAYGFGYIVHSGNTKKKNQMTIEEFSKCGKGSIIHSAKALLEGVDVPGLDLAIIAGFNSSKTNKLQGVGRVVRAEPGKTAEIFTLVLRGTVEEQWAKKAGEDMECITIDESELNKVLNHENLLKREIKQEQVKNDLLRF